MSWVKKGHTRGSARFLKFHFPDPYSFRIRMKTEGNQFTMLSWYQAKAHSTDSQRLNRCIHRLLVIINRFPTCLCSRICVNPTGYQFVLVNHYTPTEYLELIRSVPNFGIWNSESAIGVRVCFNISWRVRALVHVVLTLLQMQATLAEISNAKAILARKTRLTWVEHLIKVIFAVLVNVSCGVLCGLWLEYSGLLGAQCRRRLERTCEWCEAQEGALSRA